ncbi:MAG: anaerobic ribonucleoside-triphosphate reductase activating protein [Anaerovoracaceae bacterium]
MIEEEYTLNLAGVVRESIVDGPGFRFTVFAQGCPHGCPECHNPETHDFHGGKETPIWKILREVDKNPLLQGVTFSGGEPVCQAEAFVALAKEVKKRKLDIVLFSGYTYEELFAMAKKETKVAELLEQVDLLIDGKFKPSQKDLSLQFRGSRNQRIIDMNETRKRGEITLAKKYMK